MIDGVRREIDLAASVDQVWSYLTEPHKVARWLMGSDIDATEGARFRFTSEPSGGWDGIIECRVVEVVARRRLSYTWNANDIGAETLVTFELEDVGQGTRLTLTHTRFQDAQPGAEGRHAAGWHNVLKALRAELNGPTDGYDWSTLEITVFYDDPATDVYRRWTTAEGMRSFWADEVACVAPDGSRRAPTSAFRTGDSVDLTFTTARSTRLQILDLEDGRFLLFRFGEDYGWVKVAFSEEGDRTRLTLRQFGLPDDDASQWSVHAHARGWWIFNLLNLKAILRHGVDLRVRRPDVADGLSADFRLGADRTGAPHDWTGFDVFLQIDASPAEVLARWRSAGGLESFFVREARFTDPAGSTRGPGTLAPFQAGDHYEWGAVHDFSMEGRVLATDDQRLAFTFGSRYSVEISARASGPGALLHLRQRGIRDDPEDRVHGTLNCRSCWIYFLTTLKSQLEYGVDLRDHDPETADSIAVGYNSAVLSAT